MRPAESDADVAVAAPRAERIDYASILSPQTKWIVLAGMLMGLFLAALDQTIVATALPAIIADLRGIELAGIVIFLLGSARSGLAATMQQLIAFRILLGIGAGALTSSAFTVIV